MKRCNRWLVMLCMAGFMVAPALAGEAAEGGEGGLEAKMMFLVLQIGFILFMAKLGGWLATLMKLPSVLGELASGVVIGPYALGGIGLGSGLLAHGIFPLPEASSIPVSVELYGLCTIASVILLFLSGVETDLKMFLRYSVAGTFVGLGGVVVSFFAGDLAAVYLLPKFLPHFQGMNILSPAALFMGIMCTATSVGITARILSERKVMDSPEGTTTMAAAVIDDVLGIIVLAIGMGIIGSEKPGAAANAGVDWGKIGVIAAQTFGIWLGGTIIGIVFARKISNVLKISKSPVAVATLAFGLSLVVAGIFQSMGLSLIIGAYVMGLAFSRTDIRYLIQENLQAVYTFLVPVFFCVMGMMVDCSQLASKPVLIFGGIFTLLAVAAKIVGCSIPSFFCGFNTLGALRIGTGMIPRGEVALIIAGIGLSSGYLTKDVFGISILMTLLTTVVAPPLLVMLFDVKKKGVRKEKENTAGSRAVAIAMPTDTAAALMQDNLLKAFRDEGFFTALLSPRENIWQLTKDAMELTCSRTGVELRFECTPREQEYVETAIREVASQLNAMSRDLARPIQTGQLDAMLRNDAEQPPVSEERSSSIDRYIRRFEMLPDISPKSFGDLVDILTEKLAQAGKIKDLAAARDAIKSREAAMSTGLNHMLGAPHGRTDAVDGLVGAVAFTKDPSGVPGYTTIDGQPVRIAILTIAGESGASPHLQLMAYLSRLLREPEVSAKLLECATPEQMMSFILAGGKAKQ